MAQPASPGVSHNDIFAAAERTMAQPGTASFRPLCCHMECRLGLHFCRAGPLPKRIHAARAASGLAGQCTSRQAVVAVGCSIVDGISKRHSQYVVCKYAAACHLGILQDCQPSFRAKASAPAVCPCEDRFEWVEVVEDIVLLEGTATRDQTTVVFKANSIGFQV